MKRAAVDPASHLGLKEARGAACSRSGSTAPQESSGGSWVSLDQPRALLMQAAAPPWERDALIDANFSTEPVAWERNAAGGYWEHAIVWCPVPTGATVAIHRFTARQPAEATLESVKTLIHNLARDEMAAAALKDDDECDAASNVGGYHGERDLCERLAVRSSPLPSLLGDAVQRASRFEASALRRMPIPTRADEAWVNVLQPGSWNMLHTHEGSTYSGVLYVADGGCCSDETGETDEIGQRSVMSSRGELMRHFGGRLAFATNAPHELLSDILGYPYPSADIDSFQAHYDYKQKPGVAGAPRSRDHLEPPVRFLVLDPTPGTCVVFPSFLPHFVLPIAIDATRATPTVESSDGRGTELARSTRLSVAFNFGASEPVLLQLWLLPSQPKENGSGCDRQALPRVKVLLEVVRDLY